LTVRHVYSDAEEVFRKKISEFHEKFVDCFLLTGLADEQTPLEEIKMTKNPKFTMLYYKRIVGGIMKHSPIFCAQSFISSKLNASCNIYYLNNDKDIEDFFLYQRVGNPTTPDKILVSIWKMHFHALTEFNDFWLDEER